MRGTSLRVRHIVGASALSCASILSALSFASLPAGAQTAPAQTTPVSCPQLSVGNPNPGDNITSGGYVISGEAFDPAATSGAGISNVELFLGERDQGGLFLGSAVPGSAGTDPRAFSVEVTVPSNFNRQIDFAAYALSSVSGTETTVTFPVFVGTQPKPVGLVTPTPVPTQMTVTNNCPASAVTSSSQPAAPAVNVATPGIPVAAATTSASSSTSAASNACPTLSLANPNPGDHLTSGGLFISGATSGASRVDLFLGERDQGGLFLGTGMPGTAAGGNPNAFNVEVTIPNLGRGLDFAAYAIGTNGQEQVITFPVFVGAEPANNAGAATPTPVPATQTVTSTCMR